MAESGFVLAPSTVVARFALMPVKSILYTLEMLNMRGTHPGLSDWVDETYSTLTPERRKLNKMYDMVALGDCESYALTDFQAYIDHLAGADAEAQRDLVVQHYAEKLDLSPEVLLHDLEAFMTAVHEKWGPEYREKGIDFDPEPYEFLHLVLQDPQNMRDVVVEHLQYMWDNYLREDWERSRPMLQESVSAFQAIDYSGQTAIEVTRAVTGRDLSGYWEPLDTATHITLIPSRHIGPYVAIDFESDKRMVYLFFGARIPRDASAAPGTLSRAELLVRLNALADDTRLVILELLSRHKELCAQDIMNILNLSQSSASRHLRQLTATGYLIERRREVAKCYMLNTERVDETMQALKQFLGSGQKG